MDVLPEIDWKTIAEGRARHQAKTHDVREELLNEAYQKIGWCIPAFIGIPFLGHWLLPHEKVFIGIMWGVNLGIIIGTLRSLHWVGNYTRRHQLEEYWENEHPIKEGL
ncbi:MAG: hypothetical protein JWO08_3323 [Verrucomicrobiaceae bacterium]|nr:hypothetical protein [Verrucomicrobiaceae bacterium]